jgi:ceramide glucosyltransferase
MQQWLDTLHMTLEIALIVGGAAWTLALIAAPIFRARSRRLPRGEFCPPVSLLKPVYGLEKDLYENLRSACLQDYPDYQVVFSVQRRDDPAIPLLQRLQHEFGAERVTVVIDAVEVGLNGKINNLSGAMPHARHDVLVISDSDVRLRPDYLRAIVAPLADPRVGATTALFRAIGASTWYERMELLTLDADQFAMAMLAQVFRLSEFCFGASTALRRETLQQIGGFEALGDYLVEDNELGRRVLQRGLTIEVLPYVVDTTIDLDGAAHWWQKQMYWDQNTRAAVPALFLATLLLRVIPLALLYAAISGWSAPALSVLFSLAALRMLSAGAVIGVALNDRPAIANLWLLPIKDCLSLIWFAQSIAKGTVIWRGVEMELTRDGRLRALAERGP